MAPLHLCCKLVKKLLLIIFDHGRRFVIQTLIIMTEELKQAGTFGVFESIIRQEILKSEQKCQAIGKLEDAKKELIRLSQSIHKNVLQYEAKLKGKDLVILEQTVSNSLLNI